MKKGFPSIFKINKKEERYTEIQNDKNYLSQFISYILLQNCVTFYSIYIRFSVLIEFYTFEKKGYFKRI